MQITVSRVGKDCVQSMISVCLHPKRSRGNRSCRAVLCCRWQILKRESDDGFSHKPKLTPQQAAEAQQLLPELARKLHHNVSCALTFTHASPTTMQSAWHSGCAASKVPRHFSCHTVALPSTPSRSPCSEASSSHSIASGTLQPPHVRCDRSAPQLLHCCRCCCTDC